MISEATALDVKMRRVFAKPLEGFEGKERVSRRLRSVARTEDVAFS